MVSEWEKKKLSCIYIDLINEDDGEVLPLLEEVYYLSTNRGVCLKVDQEPSPLYEKIEDMDFQFITEKRPSGNYFLYLFHKGCEYANKYISNLFETQELAVSVF